MRSENREVMTAIHLGGVLGKQFGKVHRRLISTTHEATRALVATIKGFEQYMISSQRCGLTYAVFRGKKNIGIDDLGLSVPLLYGKRRIGGAIISAGIYVEGQQ